jgi:hypothetical protein
MLEKFPVVPQINYWTLPVVNSPGNIFHLKIKPHFIWGIAVYISITFQLGKTLTLNITTLILPSLIPHTLSGTPSSSASLT